MNSKDIAVRALKTFVQAFLAFTAAGVVGVVDWNTLKALLIGGVAAGISAAWNALLSEGK